MRPFIATLTLASLALALIATTPAAAAQELVSWRQDDMTGVAGWRIYLQQAHEPAARAVDVLASEAWPSVDGTYGVFVFRNPSSDLYISIVAIGTDGTESAPSWSKTVPAHGELDACHFDFDGSGQVAGPDYVTFVRYYERTCQQ